MCFLHCGLKGSESGQPPSRIRHQCVLDQLTVPYAIRRVTKVSGWEIAEHGTHRDHQRSEAAT
jgi:hypothetical protein